MINPSDVLRTSASAMSVASAALQLNEAASTDTPKQQKVV